MFNFSTDPFGKEFEEIPKLRKYDIAIVNPPASSTDPTTDFARTLRAINQVRTDDHVEIPPRAEFFDFATISEFEKQFDFANHELYMEIRNFMVAISRIFKNRYVPFTLYRRTIKAPIGLQFKIFNFLTDYGLINYAVDPKTRPCDTVADVSLWPKLLYTHNDQIFAEQTYKERLQTDANVPPIPVPQYPLMCAPYYSVDRNVKTAEVPGLMTVGGWSYEENNRLKQWMKYLYAEEDESKRNDPNGTIKVHTWEECASCVRTRTPEECAQQVMTSPLFHDFERIAITSFREFNTPKKIVKEEVLSKNPELRLAYTASHVAGEKAVKAIMSGKQYDEIESAEMANACIALEKLKKNAENVKQQNKKKILEMLDMVVSTTMASIEAKRKMISEQERDQSSTRSESDTSEE